MVQHPNFVHETLVRVMAPDYSALYRILLENSSKTEVEIQAILQPHLEALRAFHDRENGHSKVVVAFAFFSKWQAKTSDPIALAVIGSAIHLFLSEGDRK